MFKRHTPHWRGPVGLVLTGILTWLAACTGDGVSDATGPLVEPPALAIPAGETGYDLNDVANYGVPVDVNGAKWILAVDFNVGTGLINPFLTIQNNPQEEGFNTDASPLPYDDSRPQFTDALPLNVVPTIKELGGLFWREVILDANESNSDPDAQFSIDIFDLWLCEDAGAPAYTQYSDFESNGACTKIYEIDDRLWATDASTKGSGSNLDYRILIPESAFPAAATAQCPYNPGAADCGIYVILKSQMGGFGGDWATGATFEEYSTIIRPYVTVSKTANTALTRTHTWSIDKTVDVALWTMLRDESGTSNYSVDVTYDGSTDGGWMVSGDIVIHNPTNEVVSLDAVTDDISGVGAVGVTCPGWDQTGPFELAGGATLTCSYTEALPDGTSRTNTATVELTGLGINTATADVDFGAATVTEVDGTVTITDTYEGELGTLNQENGQFPYSREFFCDADEGNHPNTATIVETGQTADQSVTVSCGHLTVSKTVETSLARVWEWTIDKSVTPATWDLFSGDDGTSDWTVTVDKVGASDSQWMVTGVITVENDGNRTLNVASVTDEMSGPIAGVVTNCSQTLPYDLPVGQSLTCDYSATAPDGTARTNTATANLGGDDAGSSYLSDAEAVDFTGATTQELYAEVNVTDSNGMSWGPVSDDASWTYGETFTCDADEGPHQNTATITETGQNDDATVTVNCHDLTVSKNANTSLSRTWNWDVQKDVDESVFVPGTYDAASNTASIMFGGSIVVGWDVVLDATPTDGDHAVDGTITITNGHPTAAAELSSVSDVVSPAIAATVTCAESSVPASGSIECTYSADLPDGTARTNTATATLQNYSYDSGETGSTSGTTDFSSTAVSVDFAGATLTEIDECVDVSDVLKQGGLEVGSQDLGTYCADQGLPKTFDVSFTFGGPDGIALECGVNTFDNFGNIVTNDTATPGQAQSSINIDVLCVEGCTLTQGYWKTHNPSFGGGASKRADETWLLLGDMDGDGPEEAEQEDFFLSGDTWFGVFWTAPKGNSYYNLAHQFMAAYLNRLAGATPPLEVANALTEAQTLFETYTPAEIGALKGNDSTRKRVIELAGILGEFNEGLTGPGHCTENTEEVSAEG